MPFEFDGHVLDLARRELRRGDALIAMEPQVFDLLVFVVQNRDRVVSKDDLLAEVWGGRVVSDSTLTTRISTMRKALGDSALEQRLIRTVPRKGIRFVGSVTEDAATLAVANAPVDALGSETRPALALPDGPSIAVLPFDNLTGDKEQEYFCDGVVADIITALSRFRGLSVIARNSSFTYKGRAVDVRRVGRELGVRYVLEGSLRKSGDRIRIAGQLVDATTALHVWEGRFEGALDDIFELQDRLTGGVAGGIERKLYQVEVERARRKPTPNLDAYDHLLRAYGQVHATTLEGSNQALFHLNQAMALDPHFAAAAGLAAWCYLHRLAQGWAVNKAEEVKEGSRLARSVAGEVTDDPIAMAYAAATLAFLARDHDAATVLIDNALKLNDNAYVVLSCEGWIRVSCLEPKKAVAAFRRAYPLSPLDPLTGLSMSGLSIAHWLLGEHEESLRWARQSVRALPHFTSSHTALIQALVFADRLGEARDAARVLLQRHPTFTLANWGEAGGYRNPDVVKPRWQALLKAGIPER